MAYCIFKKLKDSLSSSHRAVEWPQILTRKCRDGKWNSWLHCTCWVPEWTHGWLRVSEIIKFLLPPILCEVNFYIGIHGHQETMTMFHAELSAEWDDTDLLNEIDCGTKSIKVGIDAKESVCLTKLRKHIVLREFWLDDHFILWGGLWTWHEDIVDIQKK